MVEQLRIEYPQSVSKACRILKMSRSVLHYKSIKDDNFFITALGSLAEKHPREGFWKSYGRLRNKGVLVNHKKLYRIYKSIGLAMRRKYKKRLPKRGKKPLVTPLKIYSIMEYRLY